MYRTHFKLHSEPFALGPNLRFLYRSRAHEETMAHLSYGLEQGEDIILITGVIGSGKTLSLHHLQAKLSQLFQQVLVNVTSVDFPEFLKLVLHELGQTWPQKTDRGELLCLLKDHALAIHDRGQKILLIVDEAQNLDAATLEGIRQLTNLGQPEKQLFQIVLAGQPSLEELIEGPQLAQLRQRIRIHYRLESMNEKETGEYIAHRMAVAGCRDQVFTRAAVARIHELSQGIPRLVNHLAGNALLTAFVAEARRVDAKHVAAEGMPEAPPAVVDGHDPGAGGSRRLQAPDPVEAGSEIMTERELPAERRPMTRHRPARSGSTRRSTAWIWVWLLLLVFVVLGVFYLTNSEMPAEQVASEPEIPVPVIEVPRDEPSPTPEESSPVPPESPPSDEERPAVAEVVSEVVDAPPRVTTMPEGYWLHVASFKEEDRAERYQTQLSDAGCPAMMRTVTLNDGDPWLRIMVGPFTARAKADSAAADLERRRLITFHRIMSY
jgi:type II secretory pathway predicted ATPase ExeA/cell division septation protein DedD